MVGKKVLVVDDEIHIVHVIAIKLRNNGYEVITSDNGREAYDLACKERPDVVIADYQMPGMTGLELAEKLRTQEQTRQTPLILLTARTFVLPEEQRQRLKIPECISKPFSPRELLMTVEGILFGSRLGVNQEI